MKIVNGLTAAFILAAAWSLPAHAQQYCSEQSLRGEYTSSFSGQILYRAPCRSCQWNHAGNVRRLWKLRIEGSRGAERRTAR